jgi:hypothetical protein
MPTEKHGETLDPRHLDRRVVERYLKRGQVDEKEYARYLKALPDLAENSQRVETAFQPSGELGPSR